ncbi:ubiquinone biosynthesis protein-like protein [Trypanosoma rangeli]|uniref:Ubiquinone biosynthesis protein COQ4 homolog, mitochondrial n=1 Tax=Trypanosoma rangeli TaxID=5698 RepID=A0A3R7M889_TRYRA|nr:ubiquinone biosynthesis protein-like protein [Trypanosoma rangeli]RNF10879.1 ubiquinone biosynthesis protein-like protein [Trypanosoma rangeli]|eukprot:RNF10879.1 ubiquinone biosynthesis protein-like protein [Trypanosoma rangeli]
MVTQGLLLLGGIAGAARSLPSFVAASVSAAWDPTNADAVAAVGEITATAALEHMKRVMLAERTGRMILKNQPCVTDDVLERASRQPPGTFGHRYALYMNHNHFRPSGRTPVTRVADPTLAYVMRRYRETHDFLHTCTGCGRTVEEELAIKLLEWRHTGIPLGLLAVLGGMPSLNRQQIKNMALYRKWAEINAPNQCHGQRYIPCMLNVWWESYIDRSLEELLEDVGITPIDVFLRERQDETV